MKIPVFVSSPTSLNIGQEASMKIVLEEINRFELEPRTLGRSDYPTELPLREVYVISRHCAGGIILGFEQFVTSSGIRKRGTDEEDAVDVGSPVKFPTPWNHLESGILYSFGLPMLVFKEDGISGGVFDRGATGAYIHKMPTPKMSYGEQRSFSGVVLKWQSKVREFYYK